MQKKTKGFLNALYRFLRQMQQREMQEANEKLKFCTMIGVRGLEGDTDQNKQ